MKNELRFLNLLCVLGALLFLAMAVVNALSSGSFLTTDNLFITLVCLVMAVVFAFIPLLQMLEEGRLAIPFKNRVRKEKFEPLPGSAPPLLDAKGRTVPPDVRSMVANMRQAQSKDQA